MTTTTNIDEVRERVAEMRRMSAEGRELAQRLLPNFLTDGGVRRAMLLLDAGDRLIDECAWVVDTFPVEVDEDADLIGGIVDTYGNVIGDLMTGLLETLVVLIEQVQGEQGEQGEQNDDEEEA